jgi:integrase
MKTASELKIFKSNGYDYIYIYFKQKIGLIRINTKYTAVKNGMTKDNLFKSNVKDYDTKNKHILKLKGRADNYIANKLFDNTGTSEINQKEAYYAVFNLTDADPAIQDNILLVPVYKTYVEKLHEEFRYRPGTLTYYENLKRHLEAFGKTLPGQKLYLSSFNSKQSLHMFSNFLGEKKLLNDNSTRKRVNSLISFLKYCTREGIFVYNPSIYSVNVKKYDLNVVALHKAEIQQLIDLKIENPKWEKIMDLFILNCFLGLRTSDLKRMDKGAFVQDEEKDYAYTSINLKTGIAVTIPITEIPLSILKKYDFNPPKYTGQYFNRELRKILEHYKLFETDVIVRRKVLKEIQDCKVLKRTIISNHTCRKSFITNCISSSIPLNAIMKASGHKQLKTLQSYVQNSSDKEQFKKLSKNMKKRRIVPQPIKYLDQAPGVVARGEVI